MKTACPVCGATFSLDTLIAQDDAREVFQKIFSVNEALTRPLLKYLGLFRPAKTKNLSWARMVSLLNELVPDIQAQKIYRNGNLYQAPIEAWVWSIGQVLIIRHSLTLPLKSHGYLYEVLSRWDGQGQPEVIANDVVVTNKPQKQSQTMVSLQILEQIKNGQ